MLANEAIRLVLQQEPNHDLLTGKRQSTAPAHDRRHAHAPACPKTKDIYLRVVREFALFLGRSPDTATVEDLRRYQVPATHPKTRCELRRHSFNKRRCKQRLDTRTEFGRFEFDNLIARDLLAIERILGEYVVEFLSTRGFDKNDAARSWYLRAGCQKTACCIVVVEKTPMRFEVSLNGGKRLYVVQKDNEHERPNEISKTRN
jgi:hypothetical protein